MLSRIKWSGLISLSALFLSTGYTNAMPDRGMSTTPQTSSESPAIPLEQRPISSTKQVLIRQLLEMTGGRKLHEQIQEMMLTQVRLQIQPMMKQAISGKSHLPPAEEQALIAQLNTRLDSFMTQFSQALRTEITYDEMLQRVYYPTYDQYFTEEDLKNLIAFYQTPIGQKMIATTPKLLQTSAQLTNQVFMPRLTQLVGRLIQQQIEQTHKEPPLKPAQ